MTLQFWLKKNYRKEWPEQTDRHTKPLIEELLQLTIKTYL